MYSDSHHGTASPFNDPPDGSHPPNGIPPALDSRLGRAVHADDIVSNSSPPTHGYAVSSQEAKHAGPENQASQLSQSTQCSWPEGDHELDVLDQEMLAEAHENGYHNQQAQDAHETEDTELEKSLAWIPKAQGRPVARSSAPLPVSRTFWSCMTKIKAQENLGSSSDTADGTGDKVPVCSGLVTHPRRPRSARTGILAVPRPLERLQDRIAASTAPQSGRDCRRLHVSPSFASSSTLNR